MHSEPALLLIGLSHREAGLAERERVAIAPDLLPIKLAAVLALADVREAWLLSTCNRTEVLVALERLDEGALDGVRRGLTEIVFAPARTAALHAFVGVEAVIHVFRVAAGLDSLVLGETQVLAQVKTAYERARQLGATGPWLDPLLQQALSAGRRVRADTSVGSGTLSVARAGVALASQVFGSFEDTRVVVVGAGETGRLAARYFRAGRPRSLVFVNRTFERAVEAAAELGVEAAPLERLAELAQAADVIVTSVEDAPNLLRAEHFAARRLKRRDRPLVLVDLSVPRAVAPDLATLNNVLCYDLDDLARIVGENRAERQRAAEEAAPILLAEVHKFLGLRTYASFSTSIARLRQRFDETRETELDECAGGKSSPELLRLAHRLTRRLLDVALEQLKENARDSVPTESLDRAYQRFLENP